jgi:hypothetical protein
MIRNGIRSDPTGIPMKIIMMSMIMITIGKSDNPCSSSFYASAISVARNMLA